MQIIGARILGYPVHGGPNQQWKQKGAHIFSVHSGHVLDIMNNDRNAGAKVKMWTLNVPHSSNQMWRLEYHHWYGWRAMLLFVFCQVVCCYKLLTLRGYYDDLVINIVVSEQSPTMLPGGVDTGTQHLPASNINNISISSLLICQYVMRYWPNTLTNVATPWMSSKWKLNIIQAAISYWL